MYKNDINYITNIKKGEEPFTQMPQELKDKWVAALRSGEYKQGNSYLGTDYTGSMNLPDKNGKYSRYCCLGVLQMVADGKVEAGRNGESYSLPSASWMKSHGFHSENSYPAHLPAFLLNGHYYEVAAMNDSVGLSFSEIADIIETQVEGL